MKLHIILSVFVLFPLYALGQDNRAPCSSTRILNDKEIYLCKKTAWIEVFEDEFLGNQLDPTKWNIYVGVPRDYVFKDQKAWHTFENILVENGVLKIRSQKEDLYNMPVVTCWDPYTVKYVDFKYTTGEIWTKQRFPYGRAEASIKIPKGKGLFPAFWMYSANPWNEIDIFEFWTEKSSSDYSKIHHMTTHADYKGETLSCASKYKGDDFSLDYHIFSVEWTEYKIRWYVDGVLKRTDHKYLTVGGQDVGCVLDSKTYYLRNDVFPKNPMNLILNVAIQVGEKAPNNATPFPTYMEVEWVRYYQNKPCLSPNMITNLTEIDFYDDTYNVVCGQEINIGNGFLLGEEQQLNVIASNEIHLKPGFRANCGSIFSSKIDEAICNDNTKDIDEKLIKAGQYDAQFDVEISINDILIFPNPINDNLIITLPSPNREYLIYMSNIKGEEIYRKSIRNQIKYEINMSTYPAGIYILNVIDIENEYVFSQKIIKT